MHFDKSKVKRNFRSLKSYAMFAMSGCMLLSMFLSSISYRSNNDDDFSPFLHNAYSQQQLSSLPSSDIIKVNLTGVVDTVDNPSVFGNDIKVGDNMIGSYTFNISAFDTNPDPTAGGYTYIEPKYWMKFKINGLTFQTNPNSTNLSIRVFDGPVGPVPERSRPDEILVSSSPAEHNSPTTGVGNISEIALYYINRTGNAIFDDSLPVRAPDLNVWSETSWFIIGPNGGKITGHLISNSMPAEQENNCVISDISRLT
jgi:hypothetical protein